MRASLVLILIVGSVAASPVLVSFSPPAMVWGDVEGSGYSWMLLLLDGEDELDASLASMGSVRVINHTILHWWYAGIGSNGLYGEHDRPDEESSLSRLGALLQENPDRWTGLYIEADAIALDVKGGQGSIAVARDGQDMRTLKPRETPHTAFHDIHVPAGPYQSLTGDLSFSFHSQGNHAVQWHEVDVSCPGECPDGAHTTTIEQSGPSTVRLQRMSYTETQFQGTMQGNGTAAAILAGGKSLDLAIDGILRLPLATCHSCQDVSGTLRLEGNITLTPLSADQNGLTANVAGNYTGARLDEATIDPATLGGMTMEATTILVAVGSATLLFLAVRYLPALTLLVRDRQTATSNESRRILLEAIRQQPGITQRGLHRTSGITRSIIERHVATLERTNLIEREQDGQATRHYPYGYRQADKPRTILDHDAALSKLYKAIQTLGKATQVEVFQRAKTWDWPASTTQYRLKRLTDAGLIHSWTERGRRWYTTP